MPEKLDQWAHEKLANPRAVPVVRLMQADMESGALGAMLVREFLTQHLGPLQAYSRPMWDFKGAKDDIRLCPGSLTREELSKAMRTLLEKDTGSLPVAHIPLYHRGDGAELVTAIPSSVSWGSCRPSSPTPR